MNFLYTYLDSKGDKTMTPQERKDLAQAKFYKNLNSIVKFYFYLFSLLFISLSTQAQNTEKFKNEKFTFDPSITQFQKVNIESFTEIKGKKISSDLNLFKLEKEKKEVKKIKFQDFTLLPFEWGASYKYNAFYTPFCYGVKEIKKNKLILYNEFFKDEKEAYKLLQYHKVGLLLIKNNNRITFWIKVFEFNDFINREKILTSYFFDKYVIIIESINPSYDFYIDDKKEKVFYKYVIFEIKENGDAVILNKRQSDKIRKSFLFQVKI